jgi:hypothetical protein
MPVKKNRQSQAVDSASDYAARVRALIKRERVAQARALVSEALEANPNDTELTSLQEVLEPPHVTPRQVRDMDRTQEYGWIVGNRDNYRGRWVAIQGSELVADAPSFAELQSRIENLEGVPLLHRIP